MKTIMTKTALSICVVLSLNANDILQNTEKIDPTENLNPTKEEHTIFIQKYNKKINENIKIELNKDIDANSIDKDDILKQKNHSEELSKELEPSDLTNIINEKQAVYKDAIDFTKQTMKNSDMENNIKQLQQNIINDSSWSFAGKKYLQDILSYQEKNIQNNIPKKEFLKEKEMIYVVISESIPENTLLNYFIDLNGYVKEVQFVLQGIIGNDIKKMMPTMNFFKNLMENANPNKNIYYEISINPKIIKALNIKQVPAIIFLENYEYTLENADSISTLNDNAKAFVFYGDMPLAYALQKINKKAKSNTLDIFINALNKTSFYNKSEKRQK